MEDRKYATIYLNDGWCNACVVTDTETAMLSGFTEKNIHQLVAVLSEKSYHVTLYRVDSPEYFEENSKTISEWKMKHGRNCGCDKCSNK